MNDELAKPNVVIELVEILLCIWEILTFNLDPETGYND
jgi:hypothetical protein